MVEGCRTVFLFRRDYRLEDNAALAAAARGGEVYCTFIFDPRQALSRRHASPRALRFLCESLVELDAALRARGGRLHVLHAAPGGTVPALAAAVARWRAARVVFGADYTPFSEKRDREIAAWCDRQGVELEVVENNLLLPVGSVQTKGGGQFKKFTPFHRAALAALKKSPPEAARLPRGARFGSDGAGLAGARLLEDLSRRYGLGPVPEHHEPGGRAAGLRLLRAAEEPANRDLLTAEGSLLSPHIRFGTLSPGECYRAFLRRGETGLVRQLIWREFYTNVIYERPELVHESTRQVRWVRNAEWLRRWKEGRTGVPLVDAAQRELRARGRAHNRARMVAASFLIYNLGLDWREAAAWYATQLVDSDNFVNNLCNWIWVSGTEAFSQDYFKIMSPELQARRFDPQCEYIRRWVPELREVPTAAILNWEKQHAKHPAYPPPMVSLAASRAAALQRYRAAASARTV